MSRTTRIAAATAAAISGFAFAASAGPASAAGTDSLAQLRAATARYHDVAVAEAEGFVDFDGECEPNMGYHYGNIARFDDKVVAGEPEVLLYVDGEDGKRLVGVEYVAIAPIGQPPVVFGQPLQQGPEVGGGMAIHAIHAYAWEHNPLGTFAAYNPKVSCTSSTSSQG